VLLNIDNEYADLEAVNARFNDELQRHIDGTLPKNHIYGLGNPDEILLSAGIRDLPIELSADRLAYKASVNYHHPFDIACLKNLPNAINNPIAVFDDVRKDGGKVILTELQHNKNNFVIAMNLRKSSDNRITGTETNTILTVFPKDQFHGVIGWFNSKDNLLRWVDKEKALHLITTQPTDLAAGGNKGRAINNAINKINDFQNPIYP
jgi:hypothetical protein